MRLDMTEGVPGRGYRHVEIEAQDHNRRVIQAVTYMADGKEFDGKPSLRYITLIREGARAHRLPKTYIRFLDAVEHAEWLVGSAPVALGKAEVRRWLKGS
jgi:hypothetical protein